MEPVVTLKCTTSALLWSNENWNTEANNNNNIINYLSILSFPDLYVWFVYRLMFNNML